MLSRTFVPWYFILLVSGLRSIAVSAEQPEYAKRVLSEEFMSEGAAFGDFNGDQQMDIVSGPYWYAGPDFLARFAYATPQVVPIAGYSSYFFSWTDDFNRDGRTDILVVGFPGQSADWYENPGDNNRFWTRHRVLDEVSNESPQFVDMTGDGKPELVCVHAKTLGYARRNDDASAPWTFVPCTNPGPFGPFTHGLGIGDVNLDGRLDLLEARGWWEQPVERDETFRFHEFRFAETGGSQMFTYDFDGDHDADVISVQNAHGWGLTWFERRGTGQDVLFVPHPILTANPADNAHGLAISQMHALELVDMDGDGIKDLVTGKRFWAHGDRDPGSLQLPVLYWFRTVRKQGQVEFEPHLLDPRCGVGTQVTVQDINADQSPDVLVGSKLGTAVLLSNPRPQEAPDNSAHIPHAEWDLPRLLRVGTDEFAQNVRTTDPLSPSDERRTFLLPAGFRADLVAAEPDIAKPMNIAFDARGRLWVSSSVEYPFPAPDDRPGRDTIKILEDTNGDGNADKVTTFADGLNIPIGLYPYRDGVICFSIPSIWWLRDLDGDDHVDVREKLLGPFDCTRDAHGMCNSFMRAYDGWIYACHGFSNHSQVAGSDGQQVDMHSGNVFRFKADGSRIEHFTHGQVNPFGLTQDQWGRLFTADCHTKPLTLLVQGGYYESFGKPHDGLGFAPSMMQHLHGSTGIAGVALGEKTNFPDVYRHSTFGGNVVTSRINRNALQVRGSGIVAEEESDFLISGDPWFRPVDLQVGPDGALYVADFYNRIIGHYEVSLQHEGRDRFRGRIWRISRDVSQARCDSCTPSPTRTVDLTKLSLEELWQECERLAPALDARVLAQIVDRYGAETDALAQQALQNAAQPALRVAGLYVLQQMGQLSDHQLKQGMLDPDPLVRSHAYQILQSEPRPRAAWKPSLEQGIRDNNAIVARSAVMAASRNPDPELVEPLISYWQQRPDADPWWQYSVRLALRNVLQQDGVFARVSGHAVTALRRTRLAEICLGLKTTEAGDYVVKHMQDLLAATRVDPPEWFSFASQYAGRERLAELATLASAHFASDTPMQVKLLRNVYQGIVRRGDAPSEPVQQWANQIATLLLHVAPQFEPDREPLHWTYIASSNDAKQENPWVTTDRRKSEDGVLDSPLLFSSFPLGEQRTGIYRSDPFAAPEYLEFYLAGHDGFPGKPLGKKNAVRLRDGATHEILMEQFPLRDDVARKIHWDLKRWAGHSVYVELVDANAESAFAWIAVGRFSLDRLNPSEVNADRQTAATLISEFQLTSLRPQLVTLVSTDSLEVTTATRIGQALASLSAHRLMLALADVPMVAGTSTTLRQAVWQAIADDNSEACVDLIESAFRVASGPEQLRLAETLSGSTDGVTVLLQLVHSGKASAQLLLKPSIRERIQASGTADQQRAWEGLTADLPPESDQLRNRLASRQLAYLQSGGSRETGQALFVQHCAACHQIAGHGKRIGPNLDGIGQRGLERVLEDVLAPHRNVDAAFRATTLTTHDGRILSGLVLPDEGSTVTIVNPQGQGTVVPSSDIDTRTLSVLSPMPDNWAEVLTEKQLCDLLAYLLSQRN